MSNISESNISNESTIVVPVSFLENLVLSLSTLQKEINALVVPKHQLTVYLNNETIHNFKDIKGMFLETCTDVKLKLSSEDFEVFYEEPDIKSYVVSMRLAHTLLTCDELSSKAKDSIKTRVKNYWKELDIIKFMSGKQDDMPVMPRFEVLIECCMFKFESDDQAEVIKNLFKNGVYDLPDYLRKYIRTLCINAFDKGLRFILDL